MDQNRDPGSEDNTQAVEHVHNAHENADALRDEARRVAASTSSADATADGAHAAGVGGEDTTRAEENVRRAHENAAALREESGRVKATTPPDAGRTSPTDR